MSWIIAGIALAGGLLSNKREGEADEAAIADNYKASQAEIEANILKKHQSSLQADNFKAGLAVQQYNMTRELATLESEQVAMAASMGKRAEGGSFENIQKVHRADVELNKARLQSAIGNASAMNALTHKALDTSSRAISDSANAYARSSRAQTKTRKIGVITGGLMSLLKAF